MDNTNVQLCSEVLKKEYAKAISHRTGKHFNSKWLFSPGKSKLVDKIAKEIKDIRLAKLFIESQFAMLPPDWCRTTFRKCYPPVNVVFGKNSWLRYGNYIADGIKQPA